MESKVIGKVYKKSSPLPGNHNGTFADGQEDGEFEIREAQNEWKGWGTALKPSFEPIIVARKPFKGSLVDNVIEWGVGGLNIDECRVGNEIITQLQKDMTTYHGNKLGAGHHTKMTGITTQTVGRFPANTILTYEQITFDEVCGGFPNTSGGTRHNTAIRQSNKNSGYGFDVNTRNEYGDSGSAARYFYCAKASKKDRDEGLEEFEAKLRNIHPTVKPTELMQYLVRLVTPNGGVILDPFNGSGSTGKAAMYENKERQKNYNYIGIELDKEYLHISKARIEYIIKE